MKRPILAEFGPEKTNGSRASNGGQMGEKPVASYAMPCGPKNMQSPGPGLRGGMNHGCCGTQGKR